MKSSMEPPLLGKRAMPSSRIVGIDLGTSNSCVAAYTSRNAEVIRNALGERTTPSVVAFSAEGTILVGSPARRQAILNPESTFFEVKRLIGRKANSPEVEAAKKILPYAIEPAPNGDAWCRTGRILMSPPEVQAHVLETLRGATATFFGESVTRAVITVPAFFDETQRQAVRDSATIAGLEAVRIIGEPTAAAVAYGYTRLDGNVAVVDFGGGTLDVTLMRVENGRFEVLSTAGDNLLGGADFDRAIARHLDAEIIERCGESALSDPVARQRLLSAAEEAKCVLSSETSAAIHLPYLLKTAAGPFDFLSSLARETYEAEVADLVDRMSEPCVAALRAARLSPGDVRDVLLVGGMSRAAVVRQRVGELFAKQPAQKVNPDEAVAMGAALVAASIGGELEAVKLVDIAPSSIGMAAAGDRYVPLIHKSAPLPARATKRFSTTTDDQTRLELSILQGEEAKASANRRLARIEIEPLPKAPAGGVTLDVSFEIDEHGRLEVTALEKGSGALLRAPITPFSGLTASQVAKLAEEHASARAKTSGAVGESPSAADGFAIHFDGGDAALETAPTDAATFSGSASRTGSPQRAAPSAPAAAGARSAERRPRAAAIAAVAAAALVAIAIALYLLAS